VTLAAGAAFSVPGSAGEKLVVVQEIRRDHLATADMAELAAAIREAVVREHDVSLGDLVLTRPGRLPKTSRQDHASRCPDPVSAGRVRHLGAAGAGETRRPAGRIGSWKRRTLTSPSS
jgi:hypothetical protein